MDAPPGTGGRAAGADRAARARRRSGGADAARPADPPLHLGGVGQPVPDRDARALLLALAADLVRRARSRRIAVAQVASAGAETRGAHDFSHRHRRPGLRQPLRRRAGSGASPRTKRPRRLPPSRPRPPRRRRPASHDRHAVALRVAGADGGRAPPRADADRSRAARPDRRAHEPTHAAPTRRRRRPDRDARRDAPRSAPRRRSASTSPRAPSAASPTAPRAARSKCPERGELVGTVIDPSRLDLH